MAEFLDKTGFSKAMQSVDVRFAQISAGGGTISSILSIGANGNWYIDGNDTGIKAQGPPGQTGPEGKQGPPSNDGGGTPIDRVIAEPDKSRIGFTLNRELVVQQTTPFQFGVVKCKAECVCCPTLISWKTMDGALRATTKQNRFMFTPIRFTDTMPNRVDLFDKLTFIKDEPTL